MLLSIHTIYEFSNNVKLTVASQEYESAFQLGL